MAKRDGSNQRTPLARLSPQARKAVIRSGEEVQFAANHVLFHAGDPGDFMYVIEEGIIDILIDNGRETKQLGKGQFLGEISLLVPGQKRTATAVAHTDCRLRLLSQQTLERLNDREPDLLVSILQHTCSYLVESERELLIAMGKNSSPERPDPSKVPADDIVIESRCMRELHDTLAKVARGPVNVLLLGETGVGKEVFAERIHALSPRSKGPLVKINCAAFSDTLFESELFGHEKGAFTGANERKIGLLEAAHGGTVFLDEVGELEVGAQAKLLRVIEDKHVRRVGSTNSIPIDVVFVSATNRDLEQEAAKGRFRSDLLYRLNTYTVDIPPLRLRRDEVLPLANKFIQAAAQRMELPSVPSLTSEAASLLQGHHWPGNIRELRNIADCAVLLCCGDTIEASHLPRQRLQPTASGQLERNLARAARDSEAPPNLSPEELQERNRIIQALAECLGNQTRAAEKLGISRRWLSTKMTRYAIPKPRRG